MLEKNFIMTIIHKEVDMIILISVGTLSFIMAFIHIMSYCVISEYMVKYKDKYPNYYEEAIHRKKRLVFPMILWSCASITALFLMFIHIMM